MVSDSVSKTNIFCRPSWATNRTFVENYFCQRLCSLNVFVTTEDNFDMAPNLILLSLFRLPCIHRTTTDSSFVVLSRSSRTSMVILKVRSEWKGSIFRNYVCFET